MFEKMAGKIKDPRLETSLPFFPRRIWVQVDRRFNMAETTEQNVQSLAEKHEAISETADDPALVSSESLLEEPAGIDKPQATGGEVLSLKDCCREAFGKITEYMHGELAGINV